MTLEFQTNRRAAANEPEAGNAGQIGRQYAYF